MKKVIYLLVLLFASAGIRAENLKEVYITCNPEEFKNIYTEFLPDIYINCSIAYQGATWDNVSLRIRGDDSRYFPKKSLKLKFDKEPFANGRSTINFNADYLDKSYMRQYISSSVMKMAGQKCFNAEHVKVFLNGEFFGLYVMVENVDEDYLSARGLDPKGNLYKASEDGASMSEYDILWLHWEKKTNAEKNWLDLDTLIKQINAVADQDFYTWCRKNFDYDEMINLIALNMIIANGSTYYHNYHLYHHPENGKWTMLPWDMDKTLSGYGWARAYDQTSGSGVPDNPYMERAILNDTMFADIRARINKIGADIFNPQKLFPIMDSLALVLESAVLADTTDNVPDLTKWKSEIGMDKIFIEKRIDFLNQQFDDKPRSFKCFKTKELYTSDVTIRWNKSFHPAGKHVKYRLSLSQKWTFNDDNTNIFIEDIDDTVYTVSASLLKPGTYWWKVEATDGTYFTDAYGDFNSFDYKPAQELPCTIDKELVLTKDKSPYKVVCNLNITETGKLIIKEGVDIVVSDSCEINIKGALSVEGKKDKPVRFIPSSDRSGWKGLRSKYPKGKININYAQFKECRIYTEWADVNIQNSDFYLLNDIDDSAVIGIVSGNFQFDTCSMRTGGKSQGLEIYNTQSCLIENSKFYGIPDPIEMIKCTGGMVRNNFIVDSPDDGIDFNGTSDVTVSGNIIAYGADKGISIGNDGYSVSKVNYISKNVIFGNRVGIEVKDSSFALLENNTFWNNKWGISIRQKWADMGGANVDIINTIIGKCSIADIEADALSKYSINYSLCDNKLFPGTGNKMADPMFVEEFANNFNLTSKSPCINSGSPNSALDPDNTIADIGALFFDYGSQKIVINEINYNSDPLYDPDDWVELYNPNSQSVDISGWVLKDEDDDNSFVLPQGTVMLPDTYLVIVKDRSKFNLVLSKVKNVVGSFGFGLAGSGDIVRLFNSNLYLIDSVAFDDKKPWPEEADGKGATLELINPSLDNNLASSWKASQGNGTPGTKNSAFNTVENPTSFSSESPIKSIFPNPANGKSNYQIEIISSGIYDLFVYNVLGQKISKIDSKTFEPGTYKAEFNTSFLSIGSYFLVIRNSNGESFAKSFRIER